MVKDNMVNISQQVELDTKKRLDKLTNDLRSYALNNGLRQPGKGEVLTRLVKLGTDTITPEGYFKS